MSKTFQKHIDAIKSGTVTKTNVAGIRKALNADARRAGGWSVSSTACLPTTEQFEEMFEALASVAPRVTGELHETGLALLQNKRYRTQLARVADIVPNVVGFKLVDFEGIGSRGDYFVPVYLAYTNGTHAFRFHNIPWQSGGNGPEVLSVMRT